MTDYNYSLPKDNTNINKQDVIQPQQKHYSKYGGYEDVLQRVSAWTVDKSYTQPGAKHMVGKDENGNVIMHKFKNEETGWCKYNFGHQAVGDLGTPGADKSFVSLTDSDGDGKFDKMDINSGIDESGRYVSTKDDGTFDKVLCHWNERKNALGIRAQALSDDEMLKRANMGI